MEHFVWLWTGTVAFIHVFWRIALIVTAIMAAVRLFSGRPVVQRLRTVAARYLPRLGFSPASVVPLLTGFSMGIAYGAGLLIGAQRVRLLPRGEVLKIAFFLSTCHAIFEDTLIFTLLGANPWILVGVRIVLALLVVRVLAGYTASSDSELRDTDA